LVIEKKKNGGGIKGGRVWGQQNEKTVSEVLPEDCSTRGSSEMPWGGDERGGR